MEVKRLWFVETKVKKELENTDGIMELYNGWYQLTNGFRNTLGLSKNNIGVKVLVEEYCEGIYVDTHTKRGKLPGSIEGSVRHFLIPEWAIKKITVVDPEVDTEYFV